MRLENCDTIDVVRSVQYLPLNKLQFLRVHNFIQYIESSYSEIESCIFIHNDQLVWSEVNPSDLHSIYGYLLNVLSPADSESNLTVHSKHVTGGSFLVGLDGEECVPAPVVYIFNKEQNKKYRLIAYSSQQSIVCCLLNGKLFFFFFLHLHINCYLLSRSDEANLTLEFLEELRGDIGPQLTSISTDLSDINNKETGKTSKSSSDLDEHVIKYLFLNELNCNHTGTVHINPKLLHKETKLPTEVLNLLTDLYLQNAGTTNSCEVIVKTLNDYWIVKRTNNWRHSFLIFNKSSTLLEISDEANKLFDQTLNDVFNRV